MKLAWAAGAVVVSAGSTVQVKLEVVASPKPSVNVRMSGVLDVTADGLPAITPVAVSRTSPAGNVPEVRANRAVGTAVKVAGRLTMSPTAEVCAPIPLRTGIGVGTDSG